MTVNGAIGSEGQLNAHLAAEFGVPIVLVSGDDKTCADASRYAPAAQRVAVKDYVSRYAAVCRPPAVTFADIRDGAKAATALATRHAPVAAGLLTVEIEVDAAQLTMNACMVPTVERVAERRVRFVAQHGVGTRRPRHEEQVAMMLAVARQWARDGRQPQRDNVLAFTADEEDSAAAGSDWLIRHHPGLFDGCTEGISESGGYGFASLRLPAEFTELNLVHGVDERVPADGLEFGVRILDRFLATTPEVSTRSFHQVARPKVTANHNQSDKRLTAPD